MGDLIGDSIRYAKKQVATPASGVVECGVAIRPLGDLATDNLTDQVDDIIWGILLSGCGGGEVCPLSFDMLL